MRIELADINVLLALVDPVHQHHDAASEWFAQASLRGWATCPLTENGLVRILSSPAYPGVQISPADALTLLDTLLENHAAAHSFWPDDISLTNRALFRSEAISGHRQLTDIYLLGLCQHHGGALVTFDTSISVAAIAEPDADLLRLLCGRPSSGPS